MEEGGPQFIAVRLANRDRQIMLITLREIESVGEGFSPRITLRSGRTFSVEADFTALARTLGFDGLPD